MFINPQSIVDKKLITGPFRVEPNAIDFTLDTLHKIDSTIFYFSNTKADVVHRHRNEVPESSAQAVARQYGLPVHASTDVDVSGWLLAPGTSYDAMSDVYIEVPEGVVAFLVIRSTANRNGVFLTGGIYDSGFKGNIGFALHNTDTGAAFIEKGTFIGQVVFADSDSAKLYAGGYNTKKGEHWTDAVAASSAPIALQDYTETVSSAAAPDVITISDVVITPNHVTSDEVIVSDDTVDTTTKAPKAAKVPKTK
jgi:deoxycytidine triphosphate deaminase